MNLNVAVLDSGSSKGNVPLTITKENPVQSDCQSAGQGGTALVWLWMAITLASDSHTEHLKPRNKPEPGGTPSSSVCYFLLHEAKSIVF